MKTVYAIIILAAIGFGGYWYFTHKSAVNGIVNNANNAKNDIVATGTADIDAVIKTAVASVSTVSPVYYLQNSRSYGASATQNICVDSSGIGSIIGTIQKYTDDVSCIVDPDFPSNSFTITVPSMANAGQYYCADQGSFAGLIPSIAPGGAFKAGIRCK